MNAPRESTDSSTAMKSDGLPRRVPFRERLSTRLAAALIMVGLIPGTVFTLYTLHTLSTLAEEASRTFLQAATRDYSDRLSTWLERGFERVSLAARLPAIEDGLPHLLAGRDPGPALVRDLDSLQSTAPVFIKSVALFDSQGNFLAAAEGSAPVDQVSASEWLREPLMTGRPAFTCSLSETSGGELAFSAPILMDRAAVGVIRIGLDLSMLDYLLAGMDTSAQDPSLVAVVQRDGVLLASTFSATPEAPVEWKAGERMPFFPTGGGFSELTEERIEDATLTYGDQDTWRVCLRPLGAAPWVVALFLPESAYLASAQRRITVARTVTGLLTLLLVGLGFASAKLLVQDISRLSAAVSRLAEGDFSVRVPIRNKDEVGLLGENFNRMANQLEHRTAALVEARLQAEAASKAKSDFLSVLSHEVRTPLNAVIGFSDLILEEGGLSADHAGSVSAIRRAGNQLLRMLNDMLDFTKLEAGRVEVDLQAVDLLSVVAEVVETATPEAVRKGLEIVIETMGHVPEMLVLDGPKLRQILVNLVFNAVKFTPQGGVHLTVEFNRTPQSQSGNLMVMVEDTGIGIRPEVRERLFKPFSQGDASVTRRFGGTGLGLAISRHMANACGGELSECSPGNGGACFVLSLPAQQDGDGILPPPGLDPRHEGKSVLLLSQNSISEAFLSDQLRKVGLRCLGLHDMPGIPPDLVLLDEPSRESGLSTTDLRPHRILLRRVPFLLLHPPTQRATRLGFGGALAVVAKPVLPFDLVKQINDLLSSD